MATTRIKGGKKLDAFLRKAKGARGVGQVEVGFYSTARYPPVRTGLKSGQRQDPVTVVEVALWNEFGTWNIPERPFFRIAIQKMGAPALRLLKAEVDPKTMVVERHTAGKLGLIGQSEVQKSIVNLRTPANAPATIKGGFVPTKTGKIIYVPGKGSSNPLIDTGFLRQSVTWKIT